VPPKSVPPKSAPPPRVPEMPPGPLPEAPPPAPEMPPDPMPEAPPPAPEMPPEPLPEAPPPVSEMPPEPMPEAPPPSLPEDEPPEVPAALTHDLDGVSDLAVITLEEEERTETEEDESEEDEPYQKVYYATDRTPLHPDFVWYLGRFMWHAILFVLAVALITVSWKFLRHPVRLIAIVLLAIGILTIGYFATVRTVDCLRVSEKYDRLGILFDDEQRRHPPGESYYADAEGEGGNLQLGVLEVSIPPVHVTGVVERQGTFGVTPDRTQVFVTHTIEFRDEGSFFDELSGHVADRDGRCPHCDQKKCMLDCTGRDAFVFVHGFNTTFEAATFRTAQIAHDLEFKGAAICYSWASRGVLSEYKPDEAAVQNTKAHLERFLMDVQKRSGARKLHVVAHSMGNRALTDVLRELAVDPDGGDPPPLNHVVLAAPDIERFHFETFLAPKIRHAGKCLTLYVSSNDEALMWSRKFHDDQRAGEVVDGNLVVVDGIDTIDVSDVACGHSYLASNGCVLNDFKMIMRREERAARRAELAEEEQDRYPYKLREDTSPLDKRYWRMTAAGP
jgi:esterase/lipase superfamily enzyme